MQNKIQPALWGGAFSGVLSALPIISAGNMCCCLWVIAGGVVAAYVLQQNQPTPVEPADGALVGLMAGIFGAVIGSVISVPLNMLMGPLQMRMLEDIVRNMPPEAQSAVRGFGGAGAFSVVAAIFGLFIGLIAGAIFGTLGGLLGAVIFRKTETPSAPVEPPFAATS
jgi:hypothetical protein